MSHLGSVVAGWSVVLVALAVYAVRVLARGRSLSRRVPPEQRRWM